MVLYRKYRPQKISELDSVSIRERLLAILSSKDLPHAFLFTGTRGLGKTSTARIIAKAINCEHPDTSGEPCNTCDTCVSIINGTNLDVLEIDAASNRGIDEIRSLREKIKLAPVVAKKKVYIIDEVHMLTNEAFNALLKTLEEPPSHAVFILCTTELQKIPQTIKSRCFHLVFERPSIEEITQSIKDVAVKEDIKLSESVMVKLAKAADGSFRDAKKLLEQALLEAQGKEITEELVEKSIGSSTYTQEFFDALTKKDLKNAFLLIQQSVQMGVLVRGWIEELLQETHKALLASYGLEDTVAYDSLRGLSQEELTQLLDVLTIAHQQSRGAVIPQMPLELAVVAYCTTKN